MNTPQQNRTIIVSLKPFYPEHRDGISKISFHLLRLNPDISFLSFANTNESPPPQFKNKIMSVETDEELCPTSKILRFFSSQPLPRLKSKFKKEMIKKIDIIKDQYDSFLFLGPQMVEILESVDPLVQAKSVISLIDSMSLYWKRRASSNRNPFLKVLYYFEFIKAIFFERKCEHIAKSTHYVSNIDRDFSQKYFSDSAKLYSITNGVEFDRYQERKSISNKKFIFVGNYSYGPNKEAAEFLISVMKELEITRPNVFELNLIGPGLNEDFTKSLPKNCHYLGFVQNIDQLYLEADIFLSPLFFGSGIKNKVLEAMASGLVTVGTPLSFDNIPVQDKINCLIIDSSSPEIWARTLITLPEDQKLLKISSNAQRLIKENFSWETKSDKYLQMLNRLSDAKK